jgi:hypothetical protein
LGSATSSRQFAPVLCASVSNVEKPSSIAFAAASLLEIPHMVFPS